MDWFEVLLLLIFFGFPILSKMLGWGQEPPTLPPVEDERESWTEQPVPVATVPPPAEAEDGSAGWVDWPGGDEGPDEESVAVEEAGPGLSTAEAVSLEPVAPVPLPVRAERAAPAAAAETLEVLRVDREAVHQRFHRRYVEARAAPAAPSPSPAARLREPGELRHAVLMAEVLGPPKSLRE